MHPTPVPMPDGTIDPIEAAFAEADAAVDRIQNLVNEALAETESAGSWTIARVHSLPTLVRAAVRGAPAADILEDLSGIDVEAAHLAIVRRTELRATKRHLILIQQALHDARMLARK